MVDDMLNLVREETERIDSRVLEPACGSGNFLVSVLRRKLNTVNERFGRSEFEKRHYALFALMCIYGVELLEDNIAECRANMVEIVADFLQVEPRDSVVRAAESVLAENIIHGDAIKMLTSEGAPIIFAEWGYLGKGKFQRRDFRLDTLVQMSSFGEDTLFGDLGKHEIFTPVRSYEPASIEDLARG